PGRRGRDRLAGLQRDAAVVVDLAEELHLELRRRAAAQRDLAGAGGEVQVRRLRDARQRHPAMEGQLGPVESQDAVDLAEAVAVAEMDDVAAGGEGEEGERSRKVLHGGGLRDGRLLGKAPGLLSRRG